MSGRLFFVFVLVLFGCLAIITSIGCDNRKCLRGHNAQVWYEPGPILIPMTTGDVTFFIPIDQPGYWTTQFVCDQYEVEKS